MPGGGTTVVVVEPNDATHMVHFVFNTAVSSDSGEPGAIEKVLELEDEVEKKRWIK